MMHKAVFWQTRGRGGIEGHPPTRLVGGALCCEFLASLWSPEYSQVSPKQKAEASHYPSHLTSMAPVCPSDLKDMSQMILRTKGPDRLPAGYEMVLYISASDSDKVGVFYVESE